MPTFRIVLWLRPGAEPPIVAELVTSGYPVQRATSMADAVRLVALGPCFLFVDTAVELGAPLLATLGPAVERASARVFLLGESRDGAAPLSKLALSPRLPLGTQVEMLAEHMRLNQRSAPRADVVMPATFVSVDGQRSDGNVLSVSETGALFVSATPPPLGCRGVVMMVHETAGTLQLQAEVVNVRKLERGAGLRFLIDSFSPLAQLQHIVTAALGLGVHRAREYCVGVFDPSRLVRRTTALVLGQAGYRVIDWEDPRKVLQALAGPERPDLLLVEPSAPALSGDRLAELVKRARTPGRRAPELRQQPGQIGVSRTVILHHGPSERAAHVVLHSGASDEVIRRAMHSTQVQDVVRKGVFADVLVSRIGAIITALQAAQPIAVAG